ncbi:MAG: histidinol dehydrogenase, partial [Prevotella sp.]|nr:histidinol dehydrogenase [Prevotella sp.]
MARWPCLPRLPSHCPPRHRTRATTFPGKVQNSWFDSKDGIILGQKVTALENVGVYVPGGKAVYPSSV